jgi:hypothetical protein
MTGSSANQAHYELSGAGGSITKAYRLADQDTRGFAIAIDGASKLAPQIGANGHEPWRQLNARLPL